MANELYTSIRANTKSVASGTPQTTDAELLIFINNGIRFILNSLPIELLYPFSTDGSNIVNDSGQALPSGILLGVKRNGYECKRVDKSMAYAYMTSRTFTITVSDYSNISVGHAITINGVKFYCVSVALTERAEFIKETSNDATAANIEDVIYATFSGSVSASVSGAVITITGADSVTTEDSTRLTVAETKTSTSLFNSTAKFPHYFIQNGKVFIKPSPTASAVGVVSYASLVLADGNSASLTIPEIENIVVLYASFLDFGHISSVWRDLAQTEIAKITAASTGYLADFEAALPSALSISLTNVEAALTKASSLIDTDFDSYLANDDVEEAQVCVAGAGSEVQRASQEIAKLSAQISQANVNTQTAAQILGEIQAGVQTASSYINMSASSLSSSGMYYKMANAELDRYIVKNAARGEQK